MKNSLDITGSEIQVAPGVRVPMPAIRFQFARSGGPGGQNVNKLSTKAELWMPIASIEGLNEAAAARLRCLTGKRLTQHDEIHLTAETTRSQETNRKVALERLVLLIRTALKEPKKRRKTRPSRAAKQRRLESKRRRGEIKRGRSGFDE